jgi:RNA polymerase sigma factor (sigma-70 family)
MTAVEHRPITIEALYQGEHSWLKTLLSRRLHCSETAADLAQDAFVRMLSTPVEFTQLGKAKAYLKQVAHGLCVDHWRRAAVQQAWEETLALTPEALHPSPEDTHILIEELVAVKAMLDDLPVPVRTTLLLSHLHGLTYKAIAEQLDVSERTIKKYMACAMARCALHMDAF